MQKELKESIAKIFILIAIIAISMCLQKYFVQKKYQNSYHKPTHQLTVQDKLRFKGGVSGG